MRYGRVPALALLLLAAVLSYLAAGREADGPSQPTQTLEEDSVYYEELPPVRIIPLDTLEPVDTGAAAPLQGAEVVGQHLLADARNRSEHLVETPWADE